MKLQQRIESLRQDSKLSLRLMRRSPIFFGAAVLTLALGIGANGAVFSILQSVLLQPLPYKDASRLVMLSHTSPDAGDNHLGMEFSGPMVISVRDAANRQFGEVAAGVVTRAAQIGAVQGEALESAIDMTIGDRTIRLNGAAVTPNFFRVLGVRAAIGRVFSDRDDDVSEAPIILSDATWRRDFGADPNVIGRAITMNSGMPRVAHAFTVVGVLPRGVHFTYPAEVQAWFVKPWTKIAGSNPNAVGDHMMVARVRDGISLLQARSVLSSMRRPPLVAPANAQGGSHDRIEFTSMRDWIVGDTRPSLYLLGGVAALLLLVTCVTVSNGLLARISERQQELAVRTALGAERSRMVQQLVVEGFLLSIAGTVAGVTLAVLTQPVLRSLLPSSLPQVGELQFNGSVVAFGALMATVTTILSAIAPALGGTREDSASTLTRAAAGATAGRATVRWRHALVGAQAALTTMLLIFSALLLTSLWRIGRVPLGFDSKNVVAIDLQLLDARYRDPSALTSFQETLLQGVRDIPSIESAGITSAIPFRGFDSPVRFELPDGERRENARVRFVDSSFFATLRVPLVRGRLLNSNDREGSAEVAVISETLARKLFGSADPIGKMIPLNHPTQIVGIVGNMRFTGLDKDPISAVYVSTLQNPRPIWTLVVRIIPDRDRKAAIEGIRRALHNTDPGLPALRVEMVDDVVDATLVSRRFYSVATGAFAIVALTLTIIGLTLVVARAVGERRRELAIRSALGATLMRLAQAAVGEAIAAIAAGVTVGLVLAAIGSVLLTQFLFQITARAPNVYAGAAFMVIGVAFAAAWMPLRRFSKSSLSLMLRQD